MFLISFMLTSSCKLKYESETRKLALYYILLYEIYVFLWNTVLSPKIAIQQK